MNGPLATVYVARTGPDERGERKTLMMHTAKVMPSHRTAGAWMLIAILATVAGLALTAVAGRLPGSEALSIEDGIDAVASIVLGLLGLALLRREVASGLGRALVAEAALTGLVWLTGGVADALARGGSPPVVAQILSLCSEAFFIAAFAVLVLAPLLLFPTGRLPSSRWRWTGWTACSGIWISMMSVLLAPGPVDEDVPAWGDNPLGVPALGGAIDAMMVVGIVLLLMALSGALAAFLSRWIRFRGARRRQMAWFSLGLAPMLIGLFTDWGTSGAVEVASAIVIFAGLIVGMGWPLLGAPGRTVDNTQERSMAAMHRPRA